jgi:hypothetical protein
MSARADKIAAQLSATSPTTSLAPVPNTDPADAGTQNKELLDRIRLRRQQELR